MSVGVHQHIRTGVSCGPLHRLDVTAGDHQLIGGTGMQWVNSGSFHSGEFFHGPFEIVDKDVPFILLMNDGKTRPVDARALTFLHRFDALTTVVDAKDYGLGNAVDSSVITYFNPLMHTAVFRVYAEELSYVRQHPLTLRRYMWKLEY